MRGFHFDERMYQRRRITVSLLLIKAVLTIICISNALVFVTFLACDQRSEYLLLGIFTLSMALIAGFGISLVNYP
jgi:hypothetical protein